MSYERTRERGYGNSIQGEVAINDVLRDFVDNLMLIFLQLL